MTSLQRSFARRLGSVALPLALAACSFSYSSERFSDSSSASSESSASSSPGAGARSYRKDVSDYTAAYVRSSTDFTAFRGGIADLAKKRGINDWESSDDTWEGIGAGLGRAGVSRVELDVYKQNLSSGNAAAMAEIQKGYDGAK